MLVLIVVVTMRHERRSKTTITRSRITPTHIQAKGLTCCVLDPKFEPKPGIFDSG